MNSNYSDINQFDRRFPTIVQLRKRAKKRMPGFAFDYLDGGCNENVNLHRNTADIREVQLRPHYLRDFNQADISYSLFGKKYDAPFGIAPVGLQGLMWPNAAEILAKSAFKHNIPFILSTVTTASIEHIAELTNGNAWFQLYNPSEEAIRDDILDRLEVSGYSNLVLLCDVPTFAYRPKEIMNGLAMPPKMSFRNFLQMAGKPRWLFNTLKYGQPKFRTMEKYMSGKMSIPGLGNWMDKTFSGRLPMSKIKKIRDKWKGKLILKGVASLEDARIANKAGIDGIIVSNHGGRQLDAGESAINAMRRIVNSYGKKMTIMMDSGLRSGPDIARCIAAGAQFTFMGRSFMYGVGALGKEGGDHTIAILKRQFQQVMEQICCEKVAHLKDHLIEV